MFKILELPPTAIEDFSSVQDEPNLFAGKSGQILSTFAWAIRCNIPLDEAILTLHRGKIKTRKFNIILIPTKRQFWNRRILDTAMELKNGMPLSVAIEHLKKYLPPYIPAAIAEAERKQTLDKVLPMIARQMRYVQKIYKHRFSVFSYPMILFLGCFSVTFFMSTFILPRFKRIFQWTYLKNENMPKITQYTLEMAPLLSLLILCIISLLLYYLVFRFFYRVEPTARIFANFFLLKIPFLGKDMKRIAIIELAGSMASYTEAGLDVIAAADLSSKTISSFWLRKKLTLFVEKTRNGEQWIDAWDEMELGFPFYDWIARNAASREKVPEGFMQIMKWLKNDVSEFSKMFMRVVEVGGILFNATIVAFIAYGLLYGIYHFTYITARNAI